MVETRELFAAEHRTCNYLLFRRPPFEPFVEGGDLGTSRP